MIFGLNRALNMWWFWSKCEFWLHDRWDALSPTLWWY